MKTIVTVLVAAALLLAGCGADTAPAGYQQISPQEAAVIMESGEAYLLLDVRTPEEFAEGHIPGAMNLANEEIGTDELPQLPEKDQLILVYCRSGNRSRQAAAKLARLGYTNVREFGGIRSWDGEIVR